ncbi:hypothetical protein [Blastococcus sp. Marseille-P5729]|uniref:hypothetical protein n=1 Tax=Blastococcus sp. Marseille-P5729 TaxID=2086582 RepID=UPI00131E824F|nr:hypothetical protein [Blastococcus sp. Marseille-P5729]
MSRPGPNQTASELEEALQLAIAAEDDAGCRIALRHHPVIVPAEPTAHGEPGWPTAKLSSGTAVLVYTSTTSLHEATGGWPHRVEEVLITQIMCAIPDPTWSIVINAALPDQLVLPPSQLARVACSSVEDDLRGGAPAFMLKPLTPVAADALLREHDPAVSGYVYPFIDLAPVSSAYELAQALVPGDEEAYLDETGAVHYVVWTAHFPSLYHPAVGGNDLHTRAVLDGPVLDDPPLRGNGLSPSRDFPIREYWVSRAVLPHRAALLRYRGPDHVEVLGSYDGLARTWAGYDGASAPTMPAPADPLSPVLLPYAGAVVTAPGGDLVDAVVGFGDDEQLRVWTRDRMPTVEDPSSLSATEPVVEHLRRAIDIDGHPAVIVASDDERVLVELAVPDRQLADQLGFPRVERGVRRKWVDRSAVSEVIALRDQARWPGSAR